MARSKLNVGGPSRSRRPRAVEVTVATAVALPGPAVLGAWTL